MPTRKNPIENNGQIINFYEHVPKKYLDDVSNPNYKLHNFDIPFRMCIVAPSGSGKTNFLLNLIKVFSQGDGTFASINIVTRNKSEPLYNYLEGEFQQIKISEGLHTCPKLDDFDKKYNHLVCFDDLVLSKHLDMVSEYYMRARKKNVSVVFLSQSYYDIPKFIRKNRTYIVLLDLGGNRREQKAILSEWAGDLDKDELMAIFNDAVSVKLRPLIIQGGRCDANRKYRKGFLQYYDLDTFLKDIPRTTKDGRKIVKKKVKEESNSDSD